MTKQVCMQCKRIKEDLFWINDYQGIPYKKVCSDKCMQQAIEELNTNIEDVEEDF